MNRFPDCPLCKSMLIESHTQLDHLPLTVKIVRCTECEFENHLMEIWPEGQYEYMFLGEFEGE
jgi:hypothetical protein